MNKLFSLTLITLSFIVSSVSAQNAWVPIHLTVSGYNTLNGVNASFQQNTCNGQDVVYIKFTNNNNYSVQLSWYNAIFTQDLKWISKEDPADKKTITLAANQSIQGDCADASTAVLIVNTIDFIPLVSQFKRYGTVALDIQTK